MRHNEPKDVKRDALSLYEKVKKSRAGEPVEWASGKYADASRRYDNAIEAFSAAYHDMGAFDDVFATVLKVEAGLDDEEFHDVYCQHFPYKEPSPEAWRAAMFAAAYLVDADQRLVKRIGLPLFLPPGADAWYGWQVDEETVALLMGTEDYNVCSVTRALSPDRVFYTAEQLDVGSEHNFADIGHRQYVTGRAIMVGYRVASDEYYDADPELAEMVTFYRGRLTGYGDFEYLSKTDRKRIVEKVD